MKKIIITLSALISFPIANQAQIVFTDIAPDASEVLSAPGRSEFQSIDFDGDGNEEYNFRWDFFEATYWFVHVTFVGDNQFNLKGTAENEFGARYITAMNTDEVVGSSGNWSASFPEPLIGDPEDNNFLGLGDKYIGVRFNIGANTHYGWILVSFDNSLKFTVKEYAYESTPNMSIKAGQKTDETSSISNLYPALNSIKTYPNPAQDIIYFEPGELQITLAEISDITGRKIAAVQTEGESRQVNVSTLPAGVYFLKLYSKQELQSITKFIKE